MERWAWRMGFSRVAGADEAGRGALAGPLVAAAVILPCTDGADAWEELNDSKLLSPAKRSRLFSRIVSRAVSWSFSCVSPAEIDALGVQEGNLRALQHAVLLLESKPELVVVDYYSLPDLGIPQWNMIRADRISLNVAAASVVAKVIRDRLMLYWSLKYPQYGFQCNKGYGTREHMEALNTFGPAPCHRRSYGRVKQLEMKL